VDTKLLEMVEARMGTAGCATLSVVPDSLASLTRRMLVDSSEYVDQAAARGCVAPLEWLTRRGATIPQFCMCSEL
jgi:hypothetical protein